MAIFISSALLFPYQQKKGNHCTNNRGIEGLPGASFYKCKAVPAFTEKEGLNKI